MRSFEEFCGRFIQIIESHAFGEAPGWKPGPRSQRTSPAFRELRKNDLSGKLRSPLFLRRIYSHGVEHDRRETERLKIPTFEKEIRPTIRDSRERQRILRAAAKTLRWQFLPKYGDVLGEELEQRIFEIIEEIKNDQFGWRNLETFEVSRLHPAIRAEDDEPGNWEPGYKKELDYDLDKISASAVDQWFYQQIDQELGKLAPNYCMTQMTRMKLIAALYGAAGLGSVQATTIKQFFASSKRKSKVG